MKSKQEVLQNFDERIHAFVRNVNKFDEPIVDVSAMADRIDTLTRERDEARVVTDAMIERAREAYRNAWWHEEAKADGEPFTMEARNRVWIAALTAAITQGDA